MASRPRRRRLQGMAAGRYWTKEITFPSGSRTWKSVPPQACLTRFCANSTPRVPNSSNSALRLLRLNRRQDERAFARRQVGEVGLADESQVQAQAVARHRTVKGRIAVEEIHPEAELLAIPCGRRGDVADEQDRRYALQDRRCGFGPRLRGVVEPGLERGPGREARLDRHDLLREGEGQGMSSTSRSVRWRWRSSRRSFPPTE